MTRLGTRLIIEVNVSDTAGNNCRNLIVSCLGQLFVRAVGQRWFSDCQPFHSSSE
jgi:hypothetical protein